MNFAIVYRIRWPLTVVPFMKESSCSIGVDMVVSDREADEWVSINSLGEN